MALYNKIIIYEFNAADTQPACKIHNTDVYILIMASVKEHFQLRSHCMFSQKCHLTVEHRSTYHVYYIYIGFSQTMPEFPGTRRCRRKATCNTHALLLSTRMYECGETRLPSPRNAVERSRCLSFHYTFPCTIQNLFVSQLNYIQTIARCVK